MSSFEITIYSLLLLVLILFAAFFSCAETGIMAVNRYRLRHKARLKQKYAIRLLQLLKRPDRLLGAILIGSTFTNMFASSLATLIAFHFWGDGGALLAALIMTFVVLIFAEIAPKTLAAMYPEKVSRLVATPIHIMLKILYPIVWLANVITNGLLRLLHVQVDNYATEPLSREELRSVVYETAGKISRQYQNMLLGILDLNKLTVDDVMIPRNDILGINIEHPLEQIVERINKFHLDWVPVYRENINQVIGVLYIRDVLKLLLMKSSINKEVLQQFIQEPYFVPEGTSLNTQLGNFQQSADKVAFIVDEYGEIQGLLTLNDILEEIVGDFTSGLNAEKRIHPQEDGTFLIDGAVSLRELNRITDWELPLGGPRTLNGLIIEHLESLPKTGIAMLINGYPIEIIEVKENRVKSARIMPRLLAAHSDEQH